ncbi:hypothetical protein evm_000463 [Chilo suppressalis]|nr:hypothetical protein evm_000411 [Chilo suppressalis]RVE55096.1 hypothetical protein evm_000463 [Chilo suppressalis]
MNYHCVPNANRCVLTTADAAGASDLMCLQKHGGAQAKMSRAFLLFLFALAVAVSCSLAAPSDVEKRSVLYPYYYRYPYDVSYYYDGGYDYLPYLI